MKPNETQNTTWKTRMRRQSKNDPERHVYSDLEDDSYNLLLETINLLRTKGWKRCAEIEESPQ